MKTGEIMKKITGIILMGALFLPGVIQAGPEEESQDMYNKIYSEAVRNILNGNSDEKIDGAIKLGGHKVTRYVRILGEELNEELEDPLIRRTPTNDPYVKSQIAWAIGRMGHRWSIPYVITALDKSLLIVDEMIKKTEAKRKFYEKNEIQGVALPPIKEGPAQMVEGHPYGASPDVYWSVADDFKGAIGINPRSEEHRIRLLGYNYVNLSMNIIRALGEIGRQNGLYFRSLKMTDESTRLLKQSMEILNKSLESDVADIRGATALALGSFGTKEAVDKLINQFDKEKDFSVKVRIARGILENDKSKTSYYQFILDSLPAPEMEVRRQAALALLELKMGESVFALKDALEVEPNNTVRNILKKAIYHAEVDNIMPVNY